MTLQAPLELSREETALVFFALIRPCLDYWSQLQITALLPSWHPGCGGSEALPVRETEAMWSAQPENDWRLGGLWSVYKACHKDDSNSNSETQAVDEVKGMAISPRYRDDIFSNHRCSRHSCPRCTGSSPARRVWAVTNCCKGLLHLVVGNDNIYCCYP